MLNFAPHIWDKRMKPSVFPTAALFLELSTESIRLRSRLVVIQTRSGPLEATGMQLRSTPHARLVRKPT